MELIKKLNKIQKELKAPKNQRNNFGNYNYRSCEDILEAVKPLLDDTTTLIIEDEIINIGNRFYVKATAKLMGGDEIITGIAYAREAEIKKGMDESQITGATSSYARKYALNGLFLIDDTKDADTMDNESANLASNSPIAPFKAVNTTYTPNPVVPSKYPPKIVGSTCPDCDGKYVKSPKTGNVFCENKCFAK